MRIIGELLIFFLLFMTNGRVLFVKHEKRDALVMLSPVSVALTLLQILAWGLDLINLYCLLLSVLILLTNFHALFRYSESLYVDHYSILMMFWAIFTTLLIIAGVVLCVFAYPITYNNSKLGITENKILYEGSIRSGFGEKRVFGKTNGILTEFAPIESDETEETEQLSVENVNLPIILFVPDKRGDTEGYKNYLQLLASKGYKVCSGDFFTDDIHYLGKKGESRIYRRFALRYQSVQDPQAFELNYTQFNYNISQEIKAFMELAKSKYGDNAKYFIVTDGMCCDSVENFCNLNPDLVLGSFKMNSVYEYKTSGYGIVSQSDPLMARILGESWDFNGIITEKLVEKTVDAIESVKIEAIKEQSLEAEKETEAAVESVESSK